MWVNKSQLVASVVLLNLLFSSAAMAADNASEDASEDAGDAPSMELLEFLGEFQTEDGQWIDPVSLLEMQQNESQSQYKRSNDEDRPDE